MAQYRVSVTLNGDAKPTILDHIYIVLQRQSDKYYLVLERWMMTESPLLSWKNKPPKGFSIPRERFDFLVDITDDELANYLEEWRVFLIQKYKRIIAARDRSCFDGLTEHWNQLLFENCARSVARFIRRFCEAQVPWAPIYTSRFVWEHLKRQVETPLGLFSYPGSMLKAAFHADFSAAQKEKYDSLSRVFRSTHLFMHMLIINTMERAGKRAGGHKRPLTELRESLHQAFVGYLSTNASEARDECVKGLRAAINKAWTSTSPEISPSFKVRAVVLNVLLAIITGFVGYTVASCINKCTTGQWTFFSRPHSWKIHEQCLADIESYATA